MSFTSPLKYAYSTDLQISQINGRSALSELFPSMDDISFVSRDFTEFDEAVNSANNFVMEITKTVNGMVKQQQYKMLSEINPKYSGKETISKDWGLNEVAKLWIIDGNRQAKFPGPMMAISLTKLVEIPQPPVPVM